MKENFINFVRNNKGLVDCVRKGNATWQSLYEVYTLYGEDEKVWSKYLNNKDSSVEELINIIKGVNLESVRKIGDGLQKTISLVQDISGNEEPVYEKRRVFEDLDD